MGVDCPTFTNFDEMLDKTKPDVVMVTTRDSFHSQYIVRALDRGFDVMTEKPMVIDEKQCQAVLDAEKRNKKKIIVTFNYRFAPKHRTVKEILMSGEIGKVLSVDFAWYLDVYHGADYFRRWHAYKNGGGSLWVHKATHHFDLVNWWLGADPVEVDGQRPASGVRQERRVPCRNCRVCPHKKDCRFYYDLNTNPTRMKLYAGAEDVDSYYRDALRVPERHRHLRFDAGDREILERRDDGVFARRAHAVRGLQRGLQRRARPSRGARPRAAAVGSAGGRRNRDLRDEELRPAQARDRSRKGEGGHGGGDDFLRDQIFRQTPAPEHMRVPDSRAGAMSCLTGIAARKSIEEKRAVKISELVKMT